MKKRRFPFFPFFDPFGDMDEMFQRLMEEMEREWMDFRDLAEEAKKRGAVVRGYRITIGPDGVPKVETFGDMPSMQMPSAAPGARKPLVEVNKKDNEVEVIAEMPGAEKDKIKTKIRGDKLIISCDEPPYYTEVEVGEVDPDSAKAEYKNGVLTVKLKPKQPPEKEIHIA